MADGGAPVLILAFVLGVAAHAEPTCASCHAREARAHLGSRHYRSATNRAFALALAETDTPVWCTSCHAPTPEGRVACRSCHGGPTLDGDPRHPQHPVPDDPALQSGERCAACHQFGLPDGHRLGPSLELVQSTVDQWRASPAAPHKPCPACHDHRARGGHHAPTVRSAVDVAVQPEGDHVWVTLTATEVGHRVPTGDPFRRLVVTSWGPRGQALGSHILGRDYGLSPWTLERDDTLVPGVPTTVRLPAGKVAVELRLVEPRHEPRLPDQEVRTVICDPCR